MTFHICWKISTRNTFGLKKKEILVPDVATIVSHVVYQPDVATPRGHILMSGSTKKQTCMNTDPVCGSNSFAIIIV